jgi:hypothetical protein
MCAREFAGAKSDLDDFPPGNKTNRRFGDTAASRHLLAAKPPPWMDAKLPLPNYDCSHNTALSN